MIYKSYEDLAVRYAEVEAQIKALANELDEMKTEIKNEMAGEDRLDLANGWHFTRYTSARKSYPTALTMELLGQEAVRVMKVDTKALEGLLELHIMDDPQSKWPMVAAQLKTSQTVDSTSTTLKLIKG